jgi:hypothetical protein
MFQLVYVSSAVTPFSKLELNALLLQARQKNTKLDVTRMLLYKDGNFVQVLEGEKEAVTSLTAVIERDSRHTGVLVILRGKTEERLFPDWSMAFRDLTDPNVKLTPGYNDFLNTPLTEAEFAREPNRCLKLLLLFKKNM